MNRVVIAGFPRTGKTTLSGELCRLFPENTTVRHTDDLIATHTWSDASQEVVRWFDEPGPWIIEGVTVSRALRKWRQQHPNEQPPIDRYIFLTNPHEPLTPGQRHLALGIETIHNEIFAWLRENVCCG